MVKQSSDWMTAREAAERLGVKLETLYAYASRGLLESVPGTRGKSRLYLREGVDRLKARHDARSGHAAVAAAALRYGEPTIDTQVAEIRPDGPYYRGYAAVALCARDVGYEAVAELLWTGALGERTTFPDSALADVLPRPSRAAPAVYFAAMMAQAALADSKRPRLARSRAEPDEHARARRIITWLANHAGGRRPEARSSRARGALTVAERFVRSFGLAATPERVRAIDQALILCAEHELNVSTFAARVTASGGADLYACLGAAFHALSGGRHGGVAARIESLLEEIGRPGRAALAVRARLARREQLPGFGHPLYPEGDPRAAALLAIADSLEGSASRLATLRALIAAVQKTRTPPPNFDIGLVALASAAGLPRGGASALFAVGRIAGWVAHALEQRAQGYLLRPRARYSAPIGEP